MYMPVHISTSESITKALYRLKSNFNNSLYFLYLFYKLLIALSSSYMQKLFHKFLINLQVRFNLMKKRSLGRVFSHNGVKCHINLKITRKKSNKVISFPRDVFHLSEENTLIRSIPTL